MDQNDQLQAKRHSLAHLLAAAVMQLWPDTKRTIGPAINNGFYYDFEFTHPVSEEDLPKIEAKMHEILPSWDTFERSELTAGEAKNEYPDNPYKQELIDEFTKDGAKVSFYKSGDYKDLCAGGHVEHMGEVDPGSFKLDKLAGAYWRGDEKNKMLTRIYGLAFNNAQELSEYLKQREEAKKRDHRKLGQELDLFTFSDLVGTGLPLFTPRGTVIRDELDKFSQELQAEGGYQRVTIPHITKVELYKTSGHYDKYPERFSVSSEESDDEFMMKPMNCPHHIQIYASRPRSYRDLPIRYMETTMVYRDEKAGELHGLARVRAATQDDSHAFCREDQIEAEFESIAGMVKLMYENVFQMPFRVRLAFRDESDKYFGDQQLWDNAESSVQKIADKLGFEYVIEKGEATFYGPKIEFIVLDAIGREHQCATIQLDFIQPERFGLEYTAEDGTTKRPVMIHKALLGSIERFLSVYIEHTAGKFPVWLAPEQIRVATVNQEEKTVTFANQLLEKAKDMGLRVTVDNNNESVGRKIRDAELMKVPYTVVVGEKEVDSGKLTPRLRKDMEVSEQHDERTIDEFLGTVANEAKTRTSKTSL